MWQDMRHGARIWLKSPGSAAAAALALALGMGANMAVCSVVNAVLLRSLPYKDADHLVILASTNTVRGIDRASVSYADFRRWKNENVFEHVVVQTMRLDLKGRGEPERVTEDRFAVMGAERFGEVSKRRWWPLQYPAARGERQVRTRTVCFPACRPSTSGGFWHPLLWSLRFCLDGVEHD
jgi:hypothetical protein